MTTYFHGGNPEMETDGLRTLYVTNSNYVVTAYDSSSSDHHQQQQQQQNMISVALPHAQSHSHVSHAPPSLQSQFITLPFAHPYQIHTHSNNDIFRRPVLQVSPTMNQQGLSLSLSSQPGHGCTVGGSTSSSAVQVITVAGVREDNGMTNFNIIGSKYLKAVQELLDEVVNVGKLQVTTTTTKTLKKEKVVQKDDINYEEHEAAGGSGGGWSSRATSDKLSVTQRQELQMKKTKLISMLDEVEQRYRQYHHQMKTVVTSFEQAAGFRSATSYTSLALKTISKQFRCLKDAITSQIKEASKSLGELEGVGEDCLGVKGEGSRRLRMIDHQIRQQRALQQLGMNIQHNAWRPQRGLPERAVTVLRAWLFEHFLHPYPKDSDKQMLAKRSGLTRNQVSNWFINARVRLWKPMVEEMYLEEVKEHPELKVSNQDTSNNNNAGRSSTVGKSNDLNYKQQQPSTTVLPVGATKAQNTSPNDISNNNSTISTSPNAAASSSFQAHPRPGFGLIGPPSSDMDGLLQYKKSRGSFLETQNSPSSIISAGEISFTSLQDHQNDNHVGAKFGARLVGYNDIGQDDQMNNNNNGGGFGAYHHDQLGELAGRFNPNHDHHHHQMAEISFSHPNNGSVSLTLGLPPGEHYNNLSQTSYFSSQNMHGFDRRVVEMVKNGGGEEQANDYHSNNMGFQNMDIQNGKRYAAADAPFLPANFVA